MIFTWHRSNFLQVRHFSFSFPPFQESSQSLLKAKVLKHVWCKFSSLWIIYFWRNFSKSLSHRVKGMLHKLISAVASSSAQPSYRGGANLTEASSVKYSRVSQPLYWNTVLHLTSFLHCKSIFFCKYRQRTLHILGNNWFLW